MHLLRAGQIACRLLEKHSKFDRDNVRRLTGVGGMTAVSRGLGPVSRETNGEASAGSAPRDSADGTEYSGRHFRLPDGVDGLMHSPSRRWTRHVL